MQIALLQHARLLGGRLYSAARRSLSLRPDMARVAPMKHLLFPWLVLLLVACGAETGPEHSTKAAQSKSGPKSGQPGTPSKRRTTGKAKKRSGARKATRRPGGKKGAGGIKQLRGKKGTKARGQPGGRKGAKAGGQPARRTTEGVDALSWASWRGPLGTGVAPHADPPTEWSEQKNIRWKVPVPGLGSSSPIVWKSRVP